LGLKSGYVKGVRRLVKNNPLPDFLTRRYPEGAFREHIPAAEVAGICAWAKAYLTGKSGSSSEKYLSSLNKQEFHDHYLANLRTLWGYIHNEPKLEVPV